MTGSELALEAWSVVPLTAAHDVRGGDDGGLLSQVMICAYCATAEFVRGFYDGFKAALTS